MGALEYLEALCRIGGGWRGGGVERVGVVWFELGWARSHKTSTGVNLFKFFVTAG